MKKPIKYTILLLITVMIAIVLGYPNSKPMLNLVTRNEETNEIEYLSVYSNKKVKKIKEFESEKIEILKTEPGTFTFYISDNRGLNKLNNTVLRDSKGMDVEINDDLNNILKLSEKIEHDISKYEIITFNNRYFVIVGLNVNWQSPNEFYEYDAKKMTLNKLTTLQGIDVTGISLPKE